jgi:ribosomal protein L1
VPVPESDFDELIERIEKLETALERIRDCDFVITLPDRMDAVRAIAREALE